MGFNQTEARPLFFEKVSGLKLTKLVLRWLFASSKALIETANGLKSNLLELDVKHYLTQLKRISNPSLGENPLSAHPSVLIRTKALNDFSITDIHKHYGNIDPRKFESWWI